MLQGYNQIRLSVVALSRVFEVQSGLLDGILVRGDEIPQGGEGRIVTRSQRKKGNHSPGYYYSSIPQLPTLSHAFMLFLQCFPYCIFTFSPFTLLFSLVPFEIPQRHCPRF